MSEITIKFVVAEDGYPKQHHYPDQEASMTEDQRWTFDRMRETYLACQRAIRIEQGMKRHAKQRNEAAQQEYREIARKHAAWQKAADEATQMLGEAG